MGTEYFSRRIILSVLLVVTFDMYSSARTLTGMHFEEVDVDPNNLPEHARDDGRWVPSRPKEHHGNKHDLVQGSDPNHLLIKHTKDDDDLQKLAHGHSEMDHMEAADQIFFTLNDLKVGKTLPIYFSRRDPANSPHLLSREEANTIPFSLAQLPYLLDLFSLSKGSPQAESVEYTIRTCEAKPLKEETKLCATSLESMLDFARATFGPDTRLKVLMTNHLTRFSAGIQNYTVLEEPREILTAKKIGCHTMPYPYVIYYCHSKENGNRLFEISLGGENGERVQAAGICHMDTSLWHPNSRAFRVMKIHPGTAPVCHFMPTDNIVWVPLNV